KDRAGRQGPYRRLKPLVDQAVRRHQLHGLHARFVGYPRKAVQDARLLEVDGFNGAMACQRDQISGLGLAKLAMAVVEHNIPARWSGTCWCGRRHGAASAAWMRSLR